MQADFCWPSEGPVRNRTRLILVTRNDKTAPLPMIVRREKADINKPGAVAQVFML